MMNIDSFRALASGQKSLDAGIILNKNKDSLSVVTRKRAFKALQGNGAANNLLVRTELFKALTCGLTNADGYISRLRNELLGAEKEKVFTVKELKDRLVKHDDVVRSLKTFENALVAAPEGPVDTDLGGLDTAAARRATSVLKADVVKDLMPDDGKMTSEWKARYDDYATKVEKGMRYVYALTPQKIREACANPENKAELMAKVENTCIALLELGEMVREHLERCDERSEGLIMLMDYCNARATEIMQVVGEVMDAIEAGEEPRVEKTIAGLVAEASLKMHGSDAFRTAVGGQVTKLTDRLRALEQDKASVCKWNAFRDLRNELETLRQTLVKAGTYGIDLANDRTKGVFVPERSIVDAYLKEVERALADVDELQQTNFTQLAVKLVEDCFPEGGLLLEKRFDPYAMSAKNCRRDLLELLNVNDSASLANLKDADLDKIRQKFKSHHPSQLANAVALLLRQLCVMRDVATGNRQIPAELMTRFLSGRIGVGTLVGAIANGFGPEQVDDQLDDRFLTGNEPLGKGGVNTVRLLTYTFPDGTTKQRVFKPETNARLGIEEQRVGQTGYDDATRIAHLNSATAKSAALLGVSYLADDVTVGMHNGKIGFFMKVAPGTDIYKLSELRRKESDERKKQAQRNPPVPPEKMTKNEKLGFLSGAFLNETTPHEKICVKMAGLQKELCELEWLDCMTGQMDRHGENYLVDVQGKGPNSVKAIDNDASFADYRVGLFKFRLTGKRLESTLANLGLRTKEALITKYGKRISYDSRGNLVLDIENDPILLRDVGRNVFGCNSLVRPRRITKALYQKLMALDAEEKKNPGFLKQTARGLFAPGAANELQLEATEARLREMIEHARWLKAEDEKVREENRQRSADNQLGNRVVDDGDWFDPVQAKGLLLDQIAAWTQLKNAYNAELKDVYKITDDIKSLGMCSWLGLGYFSRDIAPNMPHSLAELGNNLK